MITAENITDEQIREAHREGLISKVVLDLAMTPHNPHGTIRPYYREVVAQILNTRPTGGKP